MSSRRVGFGLAVVASVLLMASSAFACTIYKGKMTLTVVGGTGISTADGTKANMTYCKDPRLTTDLIAPDVGHDDVAQFNGLMNPPGDVNGLPTMTVRISTGEADECNSTNNWLPDGSYYVSYNSDFGNDCMVQVGGTPQFIHSRQYVVQGTATDPGIGNPVVQQFDNIPAVANGFANYAGICLTQVIGDDDDGGVLKGNKAPVKII